MKYMDTRIYTDEEYQKALERCIECPERADCELFLQMKGGGQVIKHCPQGRANVV
jgi:hypothetical protein